MASVENKLNHNDRELLEAGLAYFQPNDQIPKMVKSVEDINFFRNILKQVPFSEGSFACLCSLVAEAIESGRRFRTLDAVKVLHAQIRSAPPGQALTQETIRTVLRVYCPLVFRLSEEGLWRLSRILRDQELPPKAIPWFIENSNRSVHITNRLLRYPCRNHFVSGWARKQYLAGTLPQRTSELIALMIVNRIPSVASNEPPAVLAWAIYYARIPCNTKTRLLGKLVPRMSPELIVEIATRLGSVSLILRALRVISPQHLTAES